MGWYLQTAQWKMGAQRSQPQRHSRPDEVQTVVKKWEATSEGINFKKWEASFAGQKVLASAAKIIGLLKDSSESCFFIFNDTPKLTDFGVGFSRPFVKKCERIVKVWLFIQAVR